MGIGKWAEIKKLPLPAVAGMLANRSAVDLKDKWRNLVRKEGGCTGVYCESMQSHGRLRGVQVLELISCA